MNNKAISIGRVISMIMIVLCHVFFWLGISVLAQLFNVGVEIFFLISGYLYSTKEIKNARKFLVERWCKLCIPMYLVVIIVLISNILVNNDYSELKTIPIYLLNLQGLSFVILKLQMPCIPALGPLWFLTVIMMNYVLLIVVKKVEKERQWSEKENTIRKYILAIIVSCILAMYNIQTFYFIVYFIGYLLGKVNLDINLKRYCKLSVTMVGAVVARLVARSIIDGTMFYNNVIVIITHIILAVWIFISINLIYEKNKNVLNVICGMKWWKHLESLSMMIYMTHYIFLVSTFNVNQLNVSIAFKLFVFLMCTLISAKVLQLLTKKVQKSFCCFKN